MEYVVEHPNRLDVFLTEKHPSASRARIQKAIKAGQISVDEEVITKPSYQLETGELVTYNLQLTTSKQGNQKTKPIDLNLSLLHEDDHCLVINKPAGIAVHPGTGMAQDEHTLLNGIAYLFEERSIVFDPSAVLVHRLDKDTTGCLLIAKTPEAHTALQKQFEHRTVQKTYLAIVTGVPDALEAVIDAPIGRNIHDRTKMSVLQSRSSREARTTYRVLDAVDVCALLECDLHTGRTHQIRVHLTSIGHPIVGDDTYTSPQSEKLNEHHNVESICLHAWKLSFTSPSSQAVDTQALLPKNFVKSLTDFGLQKEKVVP